jgi:hypothetical protein
MIWHCALLSELFYCLPLVYDRWPRAPIRRELVPHPHHTTRLSSQW